MKKFTIVIIMLVMCMVSVHEVKAQFLNAGVRAGLSYPNLSGIDADTFTGFHAGTYFRMNFLGLWSVEPGIQYSQKGFRSLSSSQGGESSDRFHTIEVPVLVRFTLLPLVNIFAGPQASYLVGRNFSGATSFTNTDNLRNYDLSGVVGVGLNLPLGFNLQGSYDFGLTSVNYDGLDSYNNVIKISLGKDF
ncbi:porin family protein [Anditalea andensis]|uniref:Outer membrane protein beta-barrel domain-containing protein n=1 Tax=Anditalea andensis TaxID=1048983 RepID=A0A074L4A7_9BACT|nr:porin family protein [Anditalea andensis]KEO74663.1 hypothetical protein EL17_03020 [Anditalea andensis]